MILRTDTPSRYETRCPRCGHWGVVHGAADRDAARDKFILQGWQEGDRTAAKPEDIVCPDCVAVEKELLR